ncbi:hypothetical protein D3C80_1869710 [compost metagenome]
MSRTGLHADGGTIKVLDGGGAQALSHQEALAVVVVDAGEGQLEVDVAGKGPRTVAHQQIHLTGSQRSETGLPGGRYEVDLVRIAQHRSSNRAAHGHI